MKPKNFLLTLVLFFYLSSMNYGFLALELFRYDILQWYVYILGMWFFSYVICRIIYYLKDEFPSKLKEINDEELTFSS